MPNADMLLVMPKPSFTLNLSVARPVSATRKIGATELNRVLAPVIPEPRDAALAQHVVTVRILNLER